MKKLFLKIVVALVVLVLLTGFFDSVAAENLTTPLNRMPRMVHEYFVAKVKAVEKQATEKRANLQTQADAEAYINEVKEKIKLCFGDMPEKTPLNPRITGIVDRDVYTIEKLIFESRPGFLVTANLYLPKDITSPRPGVVGTCGHSNNGKASEAYQSYAQGLVRLGYVVLIYDPIGQGERWQYLDENLNKELEGTVAEHLKAGNPQFLVGDFFGAWRAWDGIRALDYLLTRAEVDPHHIGVTGNSGGGTMTTWLTGLDSRWTMSAPSCFVTTFRRNLENEIPADTEQCPPRALAFGLDHVDFLATLAPKPVIILAKEKDFFDVNGSEQAYQSLRHIYKQLDAEDNVGFYAGDNYHGYSQNNREAMYNWFNSATGLDPVDQEPDIHIEPDSVLYCTEAGQVGALNSRTVWEMTKEKSELLAKKRPVNFTHKELVEQVTKVLRLPAFADKTAPEYRQFFSYDNDRGYPKDFSITYFVETEPGLSAVVYYLSDSRIYSRPPKIGNRAVLYVSHVSSDAELRDEPLIKELLHAEPDTPFFTCDVRGIGESMPNTCGMSFWEPYGPDYFYAIHSLMLDKPYLGQKTLDVLRVLDWLQSNGYDDIHIVGKGFGALPATFAALLSDQVTKVTLKNALTSYTDIAESREYTWPLSTFLPNVLEYFDLPDCYEALENKQLRQIDPFGANAVLK